MDRVDAGILLWSDNVEKEVDRVVSEIYNDYYREMRGQGRYYDECHTMASFKAVMQLKDILKDVIIAARCGVHPGGVDE